MFRKINWGTAIFLSFIVFGAFIGTLVYIIQTDQRYEHSLVVEDYYKQERKLSSQLEALQNGEPWSRCLETEKNKGFLILKGCAFESIKVPIHVYGYRPNNDSKDFKIITQVYEGTVPINEKYFSTGNWILTLEWNVDDIPFRIEKKMVY
ncbi:MAG: FixH family protein [Flavobacteriaceae bacterium]